jgi:glyoxylase I family protein
MLFIQLLTVLIILSQQGVLSFFANVLTITKGLRESELRAVDSSIDSIREEIKYGGIQHCGVLVSDVEKSKSFYMTVFGFTDDSFLRPTTLPYNGAFLRVGNDQIHLMGLPNPDPTSGRPDHGGRDRHIAFTVNNIDTIVSNLNEKSVKFTLSMSGRRALFCRDLDGNAFEFVEDVSLR